MSQTNDKQVMNDSLHSRFLQSLTQTAAKMNDLVLTENGALTHASSGSALVDFNARTTELRFAEQERTIEAVAWSWDITLFINFINTYLILHVVTLKESPVSFYSSLIPQLVNSGLTWGLMMLVVCIVPEQNIIVSLIFKLLLILLFTISFAAILKQYSLKTFKNHICAIFRKE